MKKQNTRFLKYLAKYLIVAGILSLLMLPYYFVAFNSVKNNEIRSVYNVFYKGFLSFNSSVVKLQDFSEIVSGEKSIVQLTSKKGELGNKDYFTMYQANTYLSKSIVLNDFVSNIYILSKNNDTFLSNAIVSEDFRKVYGEFYDIEGYSADSWYGTLINSKEGYSFLKATDTNLNFAPPRKSLRKNILHMVVPAKNVGTYLPQYVIVYPIETDTIFEKIGSEELFESGFTYITDKTGEVVASNNYNEAPLILEEDISSRIIDSKKYTLMKIHEQDTGITAVIGIEDSYFADRVQNVYIITIIYTLIILSVAVFFAVIFAYKQYAPFEKLLNVARNILPAEGNRKNDYDYLSGTIKTLDEERNKFKEELLSLDVSVKNSLLEQVLNGHLQTQNDIERCRGLFNFVEEYFCVCMIKIKNKSYKWDEADITTRVNSAIRDALQEQGELKFSLYNVEMLKTSVIINVPTDRAEVPEEVYYALQKMSEVIKSHYDLQVVCGIGALVNGIRSAYISAEYAHNALRMSSAEKPVSICTNKQEPPSTLIWDNSTSNRLYELLSVGEITPIISFFSTIVRQSEQNNPQSTPEACQMFYGIRCTIESATNNLLGQTCKIELPNFVEDQNIREQLASFMPCCEQLCESVSSKNAEGNLKQQNKIIEYINANCMDSGLCALTIAEHFSVTEKYIYSVVKSQTQKSLGFYIEGIRFARVEELLLSTADINDIPQMVGFNSVNTFYRAFKRIYGISPGKWRQMHTSDEVTPD